VYILHNVTALLMTMAAAYGMQVNPRDSDSTPVFQLETAMGSAIECFESAGAIVVPRTRFAPVKTCNDLFVLRSDAYKVPVAYWMCPVISSWQLACELLIHTMQQLAGCPLFLWHHKNSTECHVWHRCNPPCCALI
jgi:UTP--glucose-1-phosphate uridylyltransferase